MGRARLAPSAPAISQAALYLRVSTGRQADSDLSIPDQRRQLEAFSAGRGWKVATEFLEPGNTATDDKRPAFQEMIEAAMSKPAAIEKLGPMITPESIERMAHATRADLRDAEGKYRRAHVRAVAQRVEVLSTVEIKIMGGRAELLRTMAASAGADSVLVEVRSSKPKWRARNDSNVRPSDS